MKTITILVARDQESFERDGAEFSDDHCETLKEAKIRARHLMSVEYVRMATERADAEPYRYVQICVNGECVWDRSI
jgi:hypothetical protein